MGRKIVKFILDFIILIFKLIFKIIRGIFRLITGRTKTSSIGAEGERKVIKQIKASVSNQDEHKVLNNYTIVDEEGKSHQIDHIVIRSNGIFCIETKNYKGIIRGQENQSNWTQYIGKRSYQMINPVKQNKSHIYHLNNILEQKYKINSIVVMAQNNANTIDLPYVINLKELKYYLKSFNNGVDYTIDEINDIYNLLLINKSEISNKEHVKNIKQTQKDIENNICPRCGKELILKDGKYSKFIACSEYPLCKFKKKAL